MTILFSALENQKSDFSLRPPQGLDNIESIIDKSRRT